MPKTVAYLRASTDKQDLNNQKLEILEYARTHDLKVDEFMQITISSRKTNKQRRITELLEKLEGLDILIVTELSRLGRSTTEVIGLINELIDRNVRIIIIKQGMDVNQRDQNNMTTKVMITFLSLLGELERDLISLRTKEALAGKKAQGIKLGKPKGTIQKSKFDQDRGRIEELLGLTLSVRKITKLLAYSNHHSLSTYIKKRGIQGHLPSVL
jgi:DNA invertase Pin-like site-specific DNA recombinase